MSRPKVKTAEDMVRQVIAHKGGRCKNFMGDNWGCSKCPLANTKLVACSLLPYIEQGMDLETIRLTKQKSAEEFLQKLEKLKWLEEL